MRSRSSTCESTQHLSTFPEPPATSAGGSGRVRGHVRGGYRHAPDGSGRGPPAVTVVDMPADPPSPTPRSGRRRAEPAGRTPGAGARFWAGLKHLLLCLVRPSRRMHAVVTIRAISFGLALPIAIAGIALSGDLNSQEVAPPQSPAATWPAQLAEKHGCWEHGEGNSGVEPTHVIATLDGEATAQYLGPEVTAQALEQVLGGTDHGLTVYAFCP